MKALLIDVFNSEVKVVDTVKFTDFYPLLQAGCFDIATRRIGNENRVFDLYVDDEGWLKDYPIVSALDENLSPALVGNIVVTRSENGDQIDMTDDDIDYINSYIKTVMNFHWFGNHQYPVLVEVKY